jgi:Predicted GTPase, probable translation factor
VKIGIFGLPKTGKTTLFNALTKSQAQVSDYTVVKAEPNIAMIKVGDPRVIRLSEMFKPRKTTYATIEFVDFVGVSEGAIKDEAAFPPALMKLIRSVDALALVARAFPGSSGGEASPLRDIQTIDEEMLLCDLVVAEKRLEKIRAGYQRGQKSDALLFEEKVLAKIVEQLNKSLPIRDLSFDEKEETAIRGFQFLTKKPAIAIINSDETSFGAHKAVLEELGKVHKTIEFAGSFEMELSRLENPEEAKMFMEDMGIKESARDLLTAAAYETLGYISFFTVGADEVRAWNIHRGSSAVTAAAAIHTDLARGFIAAESFSYADLLSCGSEKAVKDKGRFRLEGKDYIVKDGDILSIRFNI